MKQRASSNLDYQIGQLLRRYRLMLGLSQADIGLRMRLSAQQIQKYEAGVNRLTIGKLMEITRILGVPLEGFLDVINNDTEREMPLPSPPADSLAMSLFEHFGAIRSASNRSLVCAVAKALADKK